VKIKMSVSLAPELDHAVREAAGRAGMSLSAWLAQAAEAKLRQDRDDRILEEAAHKRRMQALGEYLDDWEAEHGAFTEEELAEAAEKLGWPWPPEGEGSK